MRQRILLAALLLCGVSGPAQERRERFVFQDNFWLNLHQFLRGEIYRRNVKANAGLDTASLSEADKQVWNRALEAYTDLAKRDLLFDNLMRTISNALATSGNADRLPASFDQAIGANTRAALNAAAPIYRERVWPGRQRKNEAWIASAKALLALHEAAMAARIEHVYRVTWPRDPLLVDVVGETGNSSAFTHEGPPGSAAHIQASAGSLRNTGDAPLELLFHEACHAEGIEDRIRGMIEDESARQNLKAPENLWHATIMFTTGEIARRELAKPGSGEYVPYNAKYNQLTPVERAAFERDWQPYLEGKAPLDQALRDLVRDAR
jgi:hypothetical protein